MASTPEAKVKRLVVDILKTHGAYYFFSATHGFGRSGVPDITACLRGRFISIECKAGKNKPTELQERELAAVKTAGGRAVVINENNMVELKAVLQEISNDIGNESRSDRTNIA